MNNNDYKVFGGWLQVFYIGGLVSSILVLLTSLFSFIGSIAILFFSFRYGISQIVSLVGTVAGAVIMFRAISQMKNGNYAFYDTYVLYYLVLAGTNIISDVINLSVSGIVISVLSAAIGLCLYTMYFSKSVRCGVYYDGKRPVNNSRYSNILRQLPAFIISDEPIGGNNNANNGNYNNAQQNNGNYNNAQQNNGNYNNAQQNNGDYNSAQQNNGDYNSAQFNTDNNNNTQSNNTDNNNQ